VLIRFVASTEPPTDVFAMPVSRRKSNTCAQLHNPGAQKLNVFATKHKLRGKIKSGNNLGWPYPYSPGPGGRLIYSGAAQRNLALNHKRTSSCYLIEPRLIGPVSRPRVARTAEAFSRCFHDILRHGFCYVVSGEHDGGNADLSKIYESVVESSGSCVENGPLHRLPFVPRSHRSQVTAGGKEKSIRGKRVCLLQKRNIAPRIGMHYLAGAYRSIATPLSASPVSRSPPAARSAGTASPGRYATHWRSANRNVPSRLLQHPPFLA
jgi:hypothetical protein